MRREEDRNTKTKMGGNEKQQGKKRDREKKIKKNRN